MKNWGTYENSPGSGPRAVRSLGRCNFENAQAARRAEREPSREPAAHLMNAGPDSTRMTHAVHANQTAAPARPTPSRKAAGTNVARMRTAPAMSPTNPGLRYFFSLIIAPAKASAAIPVKISPTATAALNTPLIPRKAWTAPTEFELYSMLSGPIPNCRSKAAAPNPNEPKTPNRAPILALAGASFVNRSPAARYRMMLITAASSPPRMFTAQNIASCLWTNGRSLFGLNSPAKLRPAEGHTTRIPNSSQPKARPATTPASPPNRRKSSTICDPSFVVPSCDRTLVPCACGFDDDDMPVTRRAVGPEVSPDPSGRARDLPLPAAPAPSRSARPSRRWR